MGVAALASAARSLAAAFGAIVLGFAGAAQAQCDLPVASAGPKARLAALVPTALPPPGEVGLTFIGHSTFLIETAGGVKIATDYNSYVRAPVVPDIVTMNNAHDTHYTDHIEPGVKHVLRGWGTGGGMAVYDLLFNDVRVRNVPTNVRDYGGTRFNGNSIFVFEAATLCIAHLGHLHHVLTPEHIAALGKIDVVLAPIDGAYTMSHDLMIEVLDQIRPPLVIPMHYFGPNVLARFVAKAGDRFTVRMSDVPFVTVSRAGLPQRPELLVLPGH